MKHQTDLRDILNHYADQINRVEFIADDPVQFPRRYSDLRDIEIAALLVSTISWGRRPMILRDAERLLQLMHDEPYHYLMSRQWQLMPDRVNIHRTFFSNNLKHYLAGLYQIYSRYGSLESYAGKVFEGVNSEHAWHLAKAINNNICEANDGCADSRCLPTGIDTTALKRLNMALRWLVRNDGVVDMGVWHVLSPSQLYIPLDVHVGRISRQLGLLTRQSDDRRAVVELTDALRRYNADDPTVYDFALFGIGVNGLKDL